MTRVFHKLICLFAGHSKDRVPMVFFRSWDSLYEVGSLRCKRCGVMLGEYKRNMEDPTKDAPLS